MTEAALLNHLWQSTAFLALAAALALGLRRQPARVRFWIWMAASLKFLIPFSALAAAGTYLGGWFAWRAPHLAPAPAWAAVSQPFHVSLVSTAVYELPARGWGWWPEVALGLWALGAALLAARWMMGWRRLAAAAHGPVMHLGELAVVTGSAAIEPGVFGIAHPVLLLPAGLCERLSPPQFQVVLAHERCHIRRRDNLWAALHALVEALFWFHPGVWWMSAQLITERERACDEDVLARGSDPEVYASGLLAVCRFYADPGGGRAWTLPCGAGIGGGGLKRRIAGILQAGSRHPAWARRVGWAPVLLLGALASASVLGPLAAGLAFSPASAPALAASLIPARRPAGPTLMRIEPRRFTATNVPLNQVVEFAYGLHPYQLEAPAWMANERIDLAATPATALAGNTAAPRLVRVLLRQRLGLAAHFANRVENVYALVPSASHRPRLVADRGPQLNFFSLRAQDGAVTGVSDLGRLADLLSRQLNLPVLNETRIAGAYPFNFALAGASPATLSLVLDRQLGLRLVPRSQTVRVLVVDRIRALRATH